MHVFNYSQLIFSLNLWVEGTLGGGNPHPKTCKPCKVEVKNKVSSAHMLHLNHTAGERVRGSFACKFLISSRHSLVPLDPVRNFINPASKSIKKPQQNPAQIQGKIQVKHSQPKCLTSLCKGVCGKLHFEYQVSIFFLQIFILIPPICLLTRGVKRSSKSIHVVTKID